MKLVEQEKWVKGDPQWGAMHRGRTYLFSGPEEQKRFLANFDKYAPALSGYDCVQYGQQGALVDGKRAHGIFYHGQIFLFADEASLVQFWEAPRTLRATGPSRAGPPGCAAAVRSELKAETERMEVVEG